MLFSFFNNFEHFLSIFFYLMRNGVRTLCSIQCLSCLPDQPRNSRRRSDIRMLCLAISCLQRSASSSSCYKNEQLQVQWCVKVVVQFERNFSYWFFFSFLFCCVKKISRGLRTVVKEWVGCFLGDNVCQLK